MKVVLFCGGLGTRLREHSDTIPKPLVSVGFRPIVWHLMRYYAHYGHRDFILCLGYRGDLVREYFLNYQEAITSDFTLHGADKRIERAAFGIDGKQPRIGIQRTFEAPGVVHLRHDTGFR